MTFYRLFSFEISWFGRPDSNKDLVDYLRLCYIYSADMYMDIYIYTYIYIHIYRSNTIEQLVVVFLLLRVFSMLVSGWKVVGWFYVWEPYPSPKTPPFPSRTKWIVVNVREFPSSKKWPKNWGRLVNYIAINMHHSLPDLARKFEKKHLRITWNLKKQRKANQEGWIWQHSQNHRIHGTGLVYLTLHKEHPEKINEIHGSVNIPVPVPWIRHGIRRTDLCAPNFRWST